MRQMQNKYGQLNITEHIITKNFWEYYITDETFGDDGDIVQAVVMGFETEIGDISLAEIKPYIITRTRNLNEVMPADGWQWVDTSINDGD
jgi:hypothetical protein